MKKFLKRINAKQKGFTLIELLVVIAIIGILAAIIVPNVSKYIGSGNQAAADSEKNIIQNAVYAAMASAKVATIHNAASGTYSIKGPTAANAANGVDLNVYSGDNTVTTDNATDKNTVGAYLGGGVDKLTPGSNYTINFDGTITAP